jgi:benzoate membrane transport protein
MTSQNVPGMAVLAGFGFKPPLGPFLAYTGTATAVGAFGGGHAINLAAISAALSAGPEGGRDPGRRWIAGVTCGAVYLAFGPLAALVAAVSTAAPAGLMLSIAGLALIGTFASSAAAALADDRTRVASAVTFLVAASGLTVGGIGAAFWALVLGGGYLLLTTVGTRR